MADEREQAQREQPIETDGGDVAERGQTVRPPKADGPVAVDGGEAVDARHSQGMVYKPSGPVTQHFGDEIHIGQVIVQASAEEEQVVQQADLQDCEQRYRERIKERFAEDVAFFVPLVSETTESTPIQVKAKAPRLALGRKRQAPLVYYELREVGQDLKRIKLDSLRKGLDRYPCIILLGDPGSGKTTVLENLAYQLADDPDRLPVLLRLSEFGPGMSLRDFIDEGWGGPKATGHWEAPNLAANLDDYLAEGRLLCMFDALNEMPREGYPERVSALRHFIDQGVAKGNRFLVTCRALDYRGDLSGLQRVELQPLNDDQIQEFLRNELPEDWQSLWQRLAEGGDDQRRLLEMARNPYLLRMMIYEYAGTERLGRNRAELMERFSQTLLRWARATCPPDEWLDTDVLCKALAVLAYEAQDRSGFGTTIKTELAKAVMPQQVQLDPRWPPVPSPADQVLSLAASASIIEMPVDRSSVRFYHHLLQEYFAARELGRQVDAGEALARYWPEGWWKPSGWEETFILLAGMEADASALLHRLVEANPVVAGRCLTRSVADAGEAIQGRIVTGLVSALSDKRASATGRAQAGDILGRLGDPRPGVGLRDDGLPDIVWCEVPEGTFPMGTPTRDIPELIKRYGGERRWYASEVPQHEVHLAAFRIAKYPVTNAQYAAFVCDGGYTERWRHCWADAGWGWKERWGGPYTDFAGGAGALPNHPVVLVSWFEATAFCRWLTARLREAGEIGEDEAVKLPSEAQWERAARGKDGRIYPWGEEADPNRANFRQPGIDATSAVGCFPGGVSPYGVEDLSGNVWEWCATKWQDSYENHRDGNDSAGVDMYVLRGGSCGYYQLFARCSSRFWHPPDLRQQDFGFRVCVSLISP